MSTVNPNNPPPQGFGTQLLQWIVDNILWIKRRLNAIDTSGGGGGTVTLPENLIAFGSNTNEVTSYIDFYYQKSVPHFNVAWPASTPAFQFLIGANRSALGDLGQYFNGIFFNVFDDGVNTFFRINAGSGTLSGSEDLLFLDYINRIYAIGALGTSGNGTKLIIDDGNQTYNYYNLGGFILKVHTTDLTVDRDRNEPDKDGEYMVSNGFSVGESGPLSAGTVSVTDINAKTSSIITLTAIGPTPVAVADTFSIVRSNGSFVINSSVGTNNDGLTFMYTLINA